MAVRLTGALRQTADLQEVDIGFPIFARNRRPIIAF